MCGNLVELHFREVNSEGFVQQPLLLAKASALKTLTLSLCQTSRLSLAEMAFNSLTCPSLTSLLIEAQSEYVRPWPKATLQGFMERSSFHLTTLSIKCVSIGDSDLIDLLCRLPSLLHLTVDNCSFIGNDPLTPLLFRTLHACPPAGYHTASSTLVPNLISLDITFIAKDWEREEWKFIDQAFVEMVQSRWLPNESADGRRTLSGADVGIACLHSVVLRLIHREIDEEIYRPLKYLEKAGMRVIIIAKNP
ncbi:hypothetical protein GYMLUDRAFT_46083 [Collybiopsis luxurians FD-317 M1]|uniref:Uncharacterized protein n=1 Tax=Collybiopsis luxurians FD-317 M1 TaxID=944289 RepID=A0A0D0CQ57_9AGAR|nr:hypothetical protein GYMLUDRAFT_46083 [Collybiopsis luxurians FD-317 M1]